MHLYQPKLTKKKTFCGSELEQVESISYLDYNSVESKVTPEWS